jgi:prepilin-type N-terminal cleavage/methylation domain-containing protein
MTLAPPGANSPRAAFTLLELLAVIALLALLGGILLGASRHAIEAGRAARARAELAADYPQTDGGAQLLQSLIGRRGPRNTILSAPVRSQLDLSQFTTANALDPNTDMSAVLVDPWGRPYRYAYKVPPSSWRNSSYVLYSLGADGLDARALLVGGFIDQSAPSNADNISTGQDSGDSHWSKCWRS